MSTSIKSAHKQEFGPGYRYTFMGFDAEAMRLLGDLVLIKRDKPPEMASARIVIPDAHSEPALTGTVVNVGPGKEWDDGTVLKTQLKRGDRVFFSSAANMPYRDVEAKRDMVLLHEADVIGVLAEAP